MEHITDWSDWEAKLKWMMIPFNNTEHDDTCALYAAEFDVPDHWDWRQQEAQGDQ